jgi:DNA-directed RNA polymerase specialized sigma24 family protein
LPDQPKDPERPETDASSEDVLAELRALSESDKTRLLVLARHLWHKFRLQSRFTEPDDLLQEAVVRIYEERRNPPPGVSFARFLWGAMMSVASNGLERDVTYDKYVRESASLDRPPARSPTSSPGGLPPAVTSESQIIARDSLDSLSDLLEDDPELLQVLKLKAQGWKPKEIRAEFTLDTTQWNTIKKRALRKLAKFKRLGV